MTANKADVEERQSLPLLHVRDITVRYGVITAINGVSLQVLPGSTVSVLGPNGAGKTTLLKTISGILTPASGEIEKSGKALEYGYPERVLGQGIALVPEGRSIFARLTVEENLRIGGSLKSRSEISESLDRELERFPILKERRTQIAGTLSGGEQQQLAIARALMSGPEILLCDEPSLGLAPKIVAQTFELLSELQSQGITTVLVEQNAHLALGISDYAYILSSGETVLEGPSQDLLSRDLTELFLGTGG